MNTPLSLGTLTRLSLCRFLHLTTPSPGHYTLEIARVDRELGFHLATFSFPEDAEDIDAIEAARGVFAEISRPNIIAISARADRDQRVLNDLIRPLGWAGLFRISPPEVLFRGSGAPSSELGGQRQEGAITLAQTVTSLARKLCEPAGQSFA